MTLLVIEHLPGCSFGENGFFTLLDVDAPGDLDIYGNEVLESLKVFWGSVYASPVAVLYCFTRFSSEFHLDLTGLFVNDRALRGLVDDRSVDVLRDSTLKDDFDAFSSVFEFNDLSVDVGQETTLLSTHSETDSFGLARKHVNVL